MAKLNSFIALGGGNEIGASCYLYSLGNHHVLIDAGIRLGSDRPHPDFGYIYSTLGGLSEIDAFFLTHAHLDHCGAITRLHHEAPGLPKYATSATLSLIEVMLQDAIQITQKRGEEGVVVNASLQLLDKTLRSFDQIDPYQQFQIGSDLLVTVIPAGHILGAVSLLFEANGLRILHTGDFCLHPQSLLPGSPLIEMIENVDALVVESTYAYQPTRSSFTFETEQTQLVREISQVIERGGNVLIPAFALGRAQEVCSIIANSFRAGDVEPFAVLTDGLVKKVNRIYDFYRDHLSPGALGKGHVIYNQWIKPTPDRFYPTHEAICDLESTCIISSSGMLIDGTRSAAYAQTLLPGRNNAILFSGYLDEESPGYRLTKLDSHDDQLRINGQLVQVRAQIKRYYLSAHAPSHDLRALISALRPQIVILVHGNHGLYSGEPEFLTFLLEQERQGMKFYHAVNQVPVYF